MEHIDCQIIIKNFLINNGYDGLYSPDYGCSCFVDELFTCYDYCGDCIPGYKSKDVSPEGEQIIVASPRQININ